MLSARQIRFRSKFKKQTAQVTSFKPTVEIDMALCWEFKQRPCSLIVLILTFSNKLQHNMLKSYFIKTWITTKENRHETKTFRYCIKATDLVDIVSFSIVHQCCTSWVRSFNLKLKWIGLVYLPSWTNLFYFYCICIRIQCLLLHTWQ